jgi:hypothetical protein
MNATHLMASEVILVSLLAGCANVPPDQACRDGLEEEFEVFHANGNRMHYHRSANFAVYLFEAEIDELVGDYESCLDHLAMARYHGHPGQGYSSAGYRGYANNGQNETSRPGATRSGAPAGSRGSNSPMGGGNSGGPRD